MVKSACGIEAVYMCFNGTGIWGGETLTTIVQTQTQFHILSPISLMRETVQDLACIVILSYFTSLGLMFHVFQRDIISFMPGEFSVTR